MVFHAEIICPMAKEIADMALDFDREKKWMPVGFWKKNQL